tara:strand:+ start:1313 stop:1717 length:405 start_codon:yes stop_codon:yes gene_type:complete
MNRLELLLKLIGGLPKSKQKEFFKKMHANRRFDQPDPKMRQRIGREDPQDILPISETDLQRIASQQQGDLQEYLRMVKLEELLGKNAGGSDEDILKVIQGLMTPVAKNRRRNFRLPISSQQDYGRFRPPTEVPF